MWKGARGKRDLFVGDSEPRHNPNVTESGHETRVLVPRRRKPRRSVTYNVRIAIPNILDRFNEILDPGAIFTL